MNEGRQATVTEAYARQKERENNAWLEQYEKREQMLLNKIDELFLLREKEELLKLFSIEETLTPYRYRSNPMIEMIAVMDIYRMEVNAGQSHTILDMSNDGNPLGREELMRRMRELRFLLWRIEFAKDETARKNLLLFLKENRVSPLFLCKAIDTMTGNVFNMLREALKLVLDAGMLRHAYWLLRAMKELMPEEESIQQLLVKLEAMCR